MKDVAAFLLEEIFLNSDIESELEPVVRLAANVPGYIKFSGSARERFVTLACLNMTD